MMRSRIAILAIMIASFGCGMLLYATTKKTKQPAGSVTRNEGVQRKLKGDDPIWSQHEGTLKDVFAGGNASASLAAWEGHLGKNITIPAEAAQFVMRYARFGLKGNELSPDMRRRAQAVRDYFRDNGKSDLAKAVEDETRAWYGVSL